MKEIIETFQINARINIYFLDVIPEAHLSDLSKDSKGRNVGKQWAHMHNVRLLWLKAAAPELLTGLTKIEEEHSCSKEPLKTALTDSGKGIVSLFEKADREGRIKGFKPHPTAFLGYIISHESHHRGQIMLTLKQNGHIVDKKIQFGLWEWGSR